MMVLRRGGFLILSVAAVLVWVAMGPDEVPSSDTGGYSSAVSQALEEAEQNEEHAGGAPQQQVVNGWVTRDLLTILAEQNNDLIAANTQAAGDGRTPALLALLVLGVSLHALTMPTIGPQGAAGEGTMRDTPMTPRSSETGTAVSDDESSTMPAPTSDPETRDENHHGHQ